MFESFNSGGSTSKLYPVVSDEFVSYGRYMVNVRNLICTTGVHHANDIILMLGVCYAADKYSAKKNLVIKPSDMKKLMELTESDTVLAAQFLEKMIDIYSANFSVDRTKYIVSSHLNELDSTWDIYILLNHHHNYNEDKTHKCSKYLLMYMNYVNHHPNNVLKSTIQKVYNELIKRQGVHI